MTSVRLAHATARVLRGDLLADALYAKLPIDIVGVGITRLPPPRWRIKKIVRDAPTLRRSVLLAERKSS